MKNFFVEKNFYKYSKQLRSEFVNNFSDSKLTHEKRFVWDFWYDQDLYHLIRTPAYYYFSQKIYQDFHSHLVQWGRENLGCHDISPTWLSYYVDGCYQKLHTDVPHGPWAFVYSLTPNKKEFIGGETLILKPETLNYWAHYKQFDNFEIKSFVDIIPSNMNQLVVFDPRFPHGVTELKGTRDPLKSRLVIHGWFVNPRPYVVGGLSTNQVQKSVELKLVHVNQLLEQIDLLDGTLSIRLNINTKGEVTNYKVLTNTLVSLKNKAEDILYFNKEIKNIFKNTRFTSTKASSSITIPLLFK